jgi:hypothetical protein
LCRSVVVAARRLFRAVETRGRASALACPMPMAKSISIQGPPVLPSKAKAPLGDCSRRRQASVANAAKQRGAHASLDALGRGGAESSANLADGPPFGESRGRGTRQGDPPSTRRIARAISRSQYYGPLA